MRRSDGIKALNQWKRSAKFQINYPQPATGWNHSLRCSSFWSEKKASWWFIRTSDIAKHQETSTSINHVPLPIDSQCHNQSLHPWNEPGRLVLYPSVSLDCGWEVLGSKKNMFWWNWPMSMAQNTSKVCFVTLFLEAIPDHSQILAICSQNAKRSGQIIIFHQPRFPWNKGISLP